MDKTLGPFLLNPKPWEEKDLSIKMMRANEPL